MIVCESIDISNNNGAGFPLGNVLMEHPRIKVVGIKATEGVHFHDPDFASFFDQAMRWRRVAIPYAFARPESDPGVAGGVAEADELLAMYGARIGHPFAGVPVLDYETTRDVAFARGFLGRILAKTSHRPLVYCSASRVAELAADSWIKANADFWVADFGVSALPPLPVSVAMWQYTDAFDTGHGRTDASHVFVGAGYLAMHPRVRVLDVLVSGKRVMRIRYGAGRVGKFLRSRKLRRMLKRHALRLLSRKARI